MLKLRSRLYIYYFTLSLGWLLPFSGTTAQAQDSCRTQFENSSEPTSNEAPLDPRLFTPFDDQKIRLRDYRMTEPEAINLWQSWHQQIEKRQYFRRPFDTPETTRLAKLGTMVPMQEIEYLSSEKSSLLPLITAFNQLQPIERAAVGFYTTNDPLSFGSNGSLWSGYWSSHKSSGWFIKSLSSALGKLPKSPGVVYSGVKIDTPFVEKFISNLFSTGTYVSRGFLSTSINAETNYTRNRPLILIIHGRSGVDVAPFSNYGFEKEILFPPGCEFKVLSIEKRPFAGAGEKIVVTLEEI